MRRAFHWFPIGLLALLTGLTFWLNRASRLPLFNADGNSRHDPDYIVENFTATRMNLDGTPEYLLTAKKMMHYPDDDSSALEMLKLTHLKDKSPPLHITAPLARATSEGKEVFFYNDVKIVREAFDQSGELVVTTPFLHFLTEQEIAKTDKPVHIQNADMEITAVGLLLNNKTRALTLSSQVKGVYAKAK